MHHLASYIFRGSYSSIKKSELYAALVLRALNLVGD